MFWFCYCMCIFLLIVRVYWLLFFIYLGVKLGLVVRVCTHDYIGNMRQGKVR